MSLSFGQSDDTDLPRDTLFSLLRNERRREVIQYLRDNDGPVDLHELSEFIAAIENDCEPSEVTYKQRKRVQTALYQMHLPKLADWDVVAYDRRAGRIELAPGADDCLPYLDAAADSTHVRGWRWYLIVAAALGAAVGVAALGVPPFASVPGVAYAVVACAAFAGISLVWAVREYGPPV
ncbi:MAG: ArsR family transcriptional regulator [Haloplanus sp.]